MLLGEASHGTSEFYRARAAITRRLIEAHGFTIVAVEADWPDAATVDRYVRHRPARAGAEPPFQRFPTWMWRNTNVDAFLGRDGRICSTRRLIPTLTMSDRRVPNRGGQWTLFSARAGR